MFKEMFLEVREVGDVEQIEVGRQLLRGQTIYVMFCAGEFFIYFDSDVVFGVQGEGIFIVFRMGYF